MHFWKNPNHPEGVVRTELHISGSEESCNYLHDLIVEITKPYDSLDEPDGYILIYTSIEAAEDAFNKLQQKLSKLYPDEVFVDKGVLYFEDCEIYVHSYPNH